jgi:hypothetical protein
MSTPRLLSCRPLRADADAIFAGYAAEPEVTRRKSRAITQGCMLRFYHRNAA